MDNYFFSKVSVPANPRSSRSEWIQKQIYVALVRWHETFYTPLMSQQIELHCTRIKLLKKTFPVKNSVANMYSQLHQFDIYGWI